MKTFEVKKKVKFGSDDFHIWHKVICTNPKGIFFVHLVTYDRLFLSNKEWSNEKGIKRFWVDKKYCKVYAKY